MSHTKGKVVLDHSIRTAINMAAPPYQHIAMVNITQNKNYTITKEEHEDNSRRIAALWNMAERLGLSTEEIATKESLFRAAADMLKVLEWYGWEVDKCRKNTLEGDRARYNLDRDGGSRAYAAIRKARGEEWGKRV